MSLYDLPRDDFNRIMGRTYVTVALLIPVGSLLFSEIYMSIRLDRPFPLWPTILLLACALLVLVIGINWAAESSKQRDAEVRMFLVLYLIVLYAVALYLLSQAKIATVRIDELTPDGVRESVLEAYNWRRAGVSVVFFLVTPLIAGVAAAFTGLWRYWVFWKDQPADPGWRATAITFGAILLLTEMFALYTVVLRDVAVGDAIEHFVWNILDAVPTLEVPQTLRWEVDRPEFNTMRAGAVLLIYKVLVILPLIALGKNFINAKRESGKLHSGQEDATQEAEGAASDTQARGRKWRWLARFR